MNFKTCHKISPAFFFALICATPFSLLQGCTDKTTVSQIVISGIPDNLPFSKTSSADILASVKSTAQNSKYLKYRPRAKDAATLRIELGGLLNKLDNPQSRYLLDNPPEIDATLKSFDETGNLDSRSIDVQFQTSVIKELSDSKSPELMISDMVSSALDRLNEQKVFMKMSVRELIEELRDKESWRRELAAEELGRRGAGESFSQLVAKLKDPDRHVSLKAVGSLIAIGNRASVPALIDFGESKDRSTKIQMLYAIARIGGPIAEAYLFVVGTGESDPVVASAAKEAFDELQKFKYSSVSKMETEKSGRIHD